MLLPETRGEKPALFHPPEFTPGQIERLEEIGGAFYSHTHGGHETVLTPSVGGLRHKNHEVERRFPYSALSRFVRDVEKETTNLSRETVFAMMGEYAVEKGWSRKERKSGKEVFLFAGCEHAEQDQKFERHLAEVDATHAFFSDITGSKWVEETKAVYYNELVNHVDPQFAKTASVEELLSHRISADPQDTRTVRDGFLRLLQYQYQLEGRGRIYIQQKVAQWDDAQIATAIREFADPVRGRNHGKWLTSLPKGSRLKLFEWIKRDTLRFIDNVLVPMKKRGTQVFVVVGNWDGKPSMELIAGDDIEPVPFDTASELHKRGIIVINEIMGLNTQTAFIVMAPYFALLHMGEMTEEQERIYRGLIKQAEEARSSGRSVIMYAHGVPDPAMHDLSKLPSIAEHNQIVAANLHRLMDDINPQEVLYPHYHDPRIDERGNVIPDNLDFVYQVDREGAPLVTDAQQIGQGDQAVGVYLPLRRFAIQVADKRGQLGLSQGRTLPAKVID